MAIQKNANLDISVAAEQNPNYNMKPSVQFSTQDRNTAKYTFTVKQDNKAVDLTDVTATVTLYMADKSVFQNNATVTNAKEGEIEYTIPPDAIRHHGSVKGELKLTYANGDALGGLRFSFNIEQSLIDKASGSTKEVYIEDFQTISNTVSKKAKEVTVNLERLEEEYQSKAYTVDEKLADVQATVTDLRENGTGIDAQARQEVEQVSAQLVDNMNDVEQRGINIMRFQHLKELKGNVYDWTKVFEAAQKYSNNIFVPSGTYYANITILNNYTTIKGNGKNNTVIIAMDDLLPTVYGNRKIYITFNGISIKTRHTNQTDSFNFVGSRYITLDDVETQQMPNENGQYSYTANGINIATLEDGWTGYNTFNRVHCRRHKYGVFSGPGLNSVLSVKDSVFSQNGYFGLYLNGISVGFLSNLDIAENGQLMPAGGEDETKYGGTYLNGSYVTIQNVWSEFNTAKAAKLNPNNIYIHPDSYAIDFKMERGARNNQGSYQMLESTGIKQNIHVSDMPSNDGLGKEKINNLISNGNFKYFSLNGQGITDWLGYYDNTVIAKETSDLPMGYETGLKLTNNSEGNRGVYQYIFDPVNSSGIIKDINRYVGKYITVTMWVKNLSSGADVRAGFDTGAVTSGVYLSTGQYQNNFPQGMYVKVVITKKITGQENRLAVGVRSFGLNSSFIVTGVSCALSPRINDSEGKPITEDGGNILSQDFKIGGKRHGYGSAIPTSGIWSTGDIIYNTSPVPGGKIGWVCVSSGTPGNWKPFGTIDS